MQKQFVCGPQSLTVCALVLRYAIVIGNILSGCDRIVGCGSGSCFNFGRFTQDLDIPWRSFIGQSVVSWRSVMGISRRVRELRQVQQLELQVSLALVICGIHWHLGEVLNEFRSRPGNFDV
jgi:hypothetical protein